MKNLILINKNLKKNNSLILFLNIFLYIEIYNIFNYKYYINF